MNKAILAVATAVLAAAACTQQQPAQIPTSARAIAYLPTDSTAKQLYPVYSARADIQKFVSIQDNPSVMIDSCTSDSVHVYSYTVQSFDLLNAMGVQASESAVMYNRCRVYLGYHVKGKNDAFPQGYKLFVVPVLDSPDSADPTFPGYDLMLDGNTHAIRNLSDTNYAHQYVLDLNAPCPCICDKRSPLRPQTSSH